MGQEILNSIFGAYRLALLDSSALRWFKISTQGFWRSFLAALFIAPPFALIVALRLEPNSTSPEAYWLMESTSYLIGWIAFPVMMIPVSWALSLSSNYFAYMIAYNWSAVVQVSIILPVVILDASGVLPAMISSFLGLLITGALMLYQWFIARTALQASQASAMLVVAIDLLLGLTLSMGIAQLF